MAIYAIGDVQGCYKALQSLLLKIHFNEHQDTLWFAGDIVNRGPDSLAVLRFIKSLGPTHQVVLGNHDFHLLLVAFGIRNENPDDTLKDILNASDKTELIDWLRHRPLLLYDQKTDFVLTHAGLAPMWTLSEAITLAKEVEKALRGKDFISLLKNLYGNEPCYWQPDLKSHERLRCIVNYLTRMRFCNELGQLDFTYKGSIDKKPAQLLPWFQVPQRQNKQVNIAFGHWAALNAKISLPHIFPLDTGCIWGNCLSAFRLDDKQYFNVPCS